MRERPVTLGTRRFFAYVVAVLSGLLIGHFITPELFGSLMQSLLLLVRS